MQKRTIATKLACAFKNVSPGDLKLVPGLVDSKAYFSTSTITRSPTEAELAMFRKQGMKMPSKVLVEGAREYAKVIYLKITGYPSIISEYKVWPLKKKDVKRLCDEVSSFYPDKGIYFTGKALNVNGRLLKTATKKEDDNFPELFGQAMDDLRNGKALMYPADSNAKKAIAALKARFGV